MRRQGRAACLAAAVCAAILGLASRAAHADEGVNSSAIVITRVIALDGPAGAKGREQEAALEAFFEAVNATGGVHGRRIDLRTTNADLRTDEQLQSVYERDRPFAFFLFGGTTGSAIAKRMAAKRKIPFVAPNSGADVFHHPPNRYVFNLRARYQDEVNAAVRHLSLVNQRRLALIHVDDDFGRDAAEGYRDAIRAAGATSVFEGVFAPTGEGLADQVAALAATDAQAIICVGSSRRVAELVTHARKKGVAATFVTLSNNASTGFARELGPHARGIIVSQVAPPPGSRSTQLSRELHLLMAVRDAEPSYAAMEAYVSAKVLVEGLRRAGPTPTREGFVQALESIKNFDLGGLEIDCSPFKRSCSRYVDLSILTEGGRYRR